MSFLAAKRISTHMIASHEGTSHRLTLDLWLAWIEGVFSFLMPLPVLEFCYLRTVDMTAAVLFEILAAGRLVSVLESEDIFSYMSIIFLVLQKIF